jgi:tetratricopeptide (TPR) repeat protein
MLTIKNRALKNATGEKSFQQCSFNPIKALSSISLINAAGFFLVLLGLSAGCTPAGPRALLQGQKLMDKGKYSEAIEKFRVATTLLNTNAQAWNYLGLACHYAGHATEAEKAYQRALLLNHDLTEAHYNLGCLWLEQNKPDAARNELTAYTLRRGNSVDCLLKLGAAQLRSHELGPPEKKFAAAEKSFDEALKIGPQSAEAFNGLGYVRSQQHRAADAAHCFKSALRQQPGYGPALLNLAVVSQQNLQDRQAALQNYREYLATKPSATAAEAVNAIVRQLEQETAPPARSAVTNAALPTVTNANPPKAPATNAPRTAVAPRIEAVSNAGKPPILTASSRSVPAGPSSRPVASSAPPVHINYELVNVAAEPVIKAGQDTVTLPAPASASSNVSSSLSHSAETKAGQHGALQVQNPVNVARSDERTSLRITPLPEVSGGAPVEPFRAKSPEPAPATGSVQSGPAKPVSGRYAYRSPAAPSPSGNRAEAERLFAQGVQAQTANRLPEAIADYRNAIQQDPSYFEAQYNLALASAEADNLPAALLAFETALAILPDSLEARYHFALALKQANYIQDAANELDKILSNYPKDTGAHLALGNLYAQQLHDSTKARQHYLKVLETDPRHPQAGAIRYWMADHPQ